MRRAIVVNILISVTNCVSTVLARRRLKPTVDVVTDIQVGLLDGKLQLT